ncbi:MAG: response regulator [Patescibacteria group bacterium]
MSKFSPIILIVEDEALLSSTLKTKLEQDSSYHVVVVDNGQDVLETAKTEHPDLILLDILLPKMDGFAVLQALKSDPDTESVPVVMLSNLGEPNDMDRAVAEGAVAYLVKSNVDPGVIVQQVKKYINIFAKDES